MNYFYFSFIYLSLVLPFLLNLIFGLQSTSIGFVVGQFMLFFFSYRFIYRKFNFKKLIYTFIAFLFFAIFCLLSSLYDFSVILNALILVFSICLTLINATFFCEFVKKNYQIFKSFINFSWYLTIAISIVSFIFLERGFLIFGEASFFALYFGPITCIYSLVNRRYFIPVILILFYSFFIPNLTMVLYFFVILIFKLPFRYFLLTFIMISILVTPKMFGEYVQSRVTLNASEANASSLTYLINWTDLKTRFEKLIVFGNGVGFKSSKVEFDNEYVSQLRLRYADMNSNVAGTFLTAKLVQSIGLVGILPSVFLCYMIMKNYFYTRKKEHDLECSIKLILCLSLLPAFFFRSSGLLSFSTFLFIFTLVYIFKSKISKRHTVSTSLFKY